MILIKMFHLAPSIPALLRQVGIYGMLQAILLDSLSIQALMEATAFLVCAPLACLGIPVSPIAGSRRGRSRIGG